MSAQTTDPGKTAQAAQTEDPPRTERGSNRKPAARRAGRPRGLWLFWLSLLLLIVVVTAGALAYRWGYGLYRGDSILPGVHVWGVDLGGQTTQQAAETLTREWAKRSIVLQDGEQQWSLPPEKLGILLDAEATVRAAHSELRQGGDPDQPRQVARRLIASLVFRNPSLQRIVRAYDPTLTAPERVELPPAWRFDGAVASETLSGLANQIEVLPQDAAVTMVDGRVEGTASSTGRALDISEALARVEGLSEELALAPADAGDSPARPEILRLPVLPLEPTVKDVSQVVAEAGRLLSNSISVGLYDPITDDRFTWTLTPDITSKWLSFGIAAGDPSRVEWSVDEAKVAETVGEQEAALGGGRYVDRQLAVPALIDAFKNGTPEINQRLYHYAQTHTVKSGETLTSIGFDYGMPYGWILAANPGMDEKVIEGQQITIPSQDNLLPLPVVENKRIKVSIGEQRVQAFENGVLKWDWPASTGLKSKPTNPGVFQIQTHEPSAYNSEADIWMPQFMGIYRPVPSVDFMNGFHGFPTSARDQRQVLWTKNLGSPITFGCVMVSTDNAKLLYDWADEGVVVEITK
jgi:lipoprotein-anchoring transpeptidase ErfK/SrfK